MLNTMISFRCCGWSLLACLTGTVAVSSIIASPASAIDLTFRQIIVDDQMPDSKAIALADFDQDGDLDFVATSASSDNVVWFENAGRFRFRRVIDAQLGKAYPISVGDLDQDGDIDVLAAGYAADLYVWYKNDGTGEFSRRVIDEIDGPHSIIPVDMDKDGDIDVVAGAENANRVAWYENDGKQHFTENVIDGELMKTKTAYPGDMDQDGKMDVIAASFSNSSVVWYRQKNDGSFRKRIIGDDFFGAYFAFPADLDEDGDLDIVVASKFDDTVSWLRNDGPLKSGGHELLFTKKIIDSNCTGARSVRVADLDGDNDRDIIAACRNNPDAQVTWYEQLGGGTFSSARVVSDKVGGAYGLYVADIDEDSRMDVLSAGDGTVSVHRQTTPRQLLR